MLQLQKDGVDVDRSDFPPGRKLIRHANDGLRVRVFFTPEEMGPSLTDDSQASALDLNEIIRRYRAAGVEPELEVGEFGDVTDIGSFQDVQVRLSEVRRVFMSLRPEVRERFRNDPAVFADFVGDPANIEEGIALGLYKPEEAKGESAEPTPPAAPKPAGRPPEGAGSGDGGSTTDRKS